MKAILFNHLVTIHHSFATAMAICGHNSSTNQDIYCDTGLPTVSASSGNLQIILQYLFGALGAVAVIMILIGAIQFITSSGDPQAVTKARETIIYSLAGILVCVSAEIIVTFILTNI